MKLTKKEQKNLENFHAYLLTCKKKQSIAEYAKMFGFKPSRLTSAFKEKYDKSLKRVELEVIMAYAMKQLIDGEKVLYIATQLGYATIGSFGRAFKTVYDRNPSFYRY